MLHLVDLHLLLGTRALLRGRVWVRTWSHLVKNFVSVKIQDFVIFGEDLVGALVIVIFLDFQSNKYLSPKKTAMKKVKSLHFAS